MNPYALITFVAFIFVMAALFLGGAMDAHDESCQPAPDDSPFDRDREFIDPREEEEWERVSHKEEDHSAFPHDDDYQINPEPRT
jgi:hypothetical protein